MMRRFRFTLRRGLEHLGLILGSTLSFLLLLNLIYGVFSNEKFSLPIQGKPYWRKSQLPGVCGEHMPGVTTQYDGVEVAINSYGFRDYEFTQERPRGLCRIVALGDSLTFGQGVVLGDTYPKQLEVMLNENANRGKRFQVLNAGVQGYNTVEEAAVLRYRILPLKPDMIILGFTEVNDPELVPIHPFSFGDRVGRSSVFHHLPLLSYLLLRIDQKIAAVEGHRHALEIYRPEGKPWQECVQALTYIRDLCHDHQINLIVALFPAFAPEGMFSQQRVQVKETLDRLRVPYLDTLPVTRDIPILEKVVSPADPHPSALVHSRFAELLYRWIIEHPPCKDGQGLEKAHNQNLKDDEE